MKPINTLKFLLCAVMTLCLGVPSAKANNKDFYSKVNVSVASGSGYVYASAVTRDVDESQITATSYTASQTSEAMSMSGSYSQPTYHIFAKPADGYAFKCWNDGNTDNPRWLTYTIEKVAEDSPTTYNYTATFEESALVAKSSDLYLGSAVVTPAINTVGSKVTLEAIPFKKTGNGEWGCGGYTVESQSVHFDGWYDADGNLISEEKKVTDYTVEKAQVITAKYSREYPVKLTSDNKIYGYYRLQLHFSGEDIHHYMCLTGDFEVGITVPSIFSDARYVNGAVSINQYPTYKTWNYPQTWNQHTYDYASSDEVFSDCGSIFYITGDANSNIYTTVPRTTIATNMSATAQGVDVSKITGSKYTLKVQTSDLPGYYMLGTETSGYFMTLQMCTWNTMWITTDKPGNYNNINVGDWDLQPVDRDHIEDSYFGPCISDKDMYYDGGYWTTMYTSFPYECYEGDGVEAYTITTTQEVGGYNYVIIKKIDGNIVPAATPVLLKCKSRKPKENRLIPLEVDDSRLSAVEIGTNLLKGEYGLYTGHTGTSSSDYGTGRATYDGGKMRVFGISNGKLGFYKLAADDEGNPRELIPNRAYLDLTQLPGYSTDGSSSVAASYRLAFDDLTGIDEVAVDGEEATQDLPKEYYNLQGQRVLEPVAGQIYIVRQGSNVSKIKL